MPVCNFAIPAMSAVMYRISGRLEFSILLMSSAIMISPSAFIAFAGMSGMNFAVQYTSAAGVVAIASAAAAIYYYRHDVFRRDTRSGGCFHDRIETGWNGERKEENGDGAEVKKSCTVSCTVSLSCPSILYILLETAAVLLIGCMLQAAVKAWIPSEWLMAIGGNFTAMNTADSMIYGLATHLCLPDDTALASAMLAGGAPSGSVITLVLVGVMTNFPLLALMTGLLGWRTCGVWLGAGVCCTGILGTAINSFYPVQASLGIDANLTSLAGRWTLTLPEIIRIPGAWILIAAGTAGWIWILTKRQDASMR